MSIEQAWQRKWSWTALLLPFSLLYYCIVQIRRLAYRLGVAQTKPASVPVIVVGNITAGGNGKTPVVVWLVELLKRHGYQPAVVSRGYGGTSDHYPLSVTATTSASQSGDEPKLLAGRLAVPVIVDPNRANAVEAAANLGANVVISDDGLQHYRMARAIELAVIDGERRHGNGWMLPSGPLREPPSRLNKVFATICNGGCAQPGEYLMNLQPNAGWFAVGNEGGKRESDSFSGLKALAIAGIGNPQRFFNTLKDLKIDADTLPLADHAAISQTMLDAWLKQYDVVLMTEKDAVKCADLSAINCYFLPVDASIEGDLKQQILEKLQSISGAEHGV